MVVGEWIWNSDAALMMVIYLCQWFYLRIRITVIEYSIRIQIIKGCTTAKVGPSWTKSKSIIIDNGVKCPPIVDKTNWLGGHNYGDRFSIAQNGNRVTITRTDRHGGWGMNLKFRCCPDDGNIFMPIILFKNKNNSNEIFYKNSNCLRLYDSQGRTI